QQVREYLAELGFRSIEEAVGHVELLDTRPAIEHWKAQGLDLAPVLAVPPAGAPLHHAIAQEHGLEDTLDRDLIEHAREALESGTPVALERVVRNTHRTVGTMLGYEVTKRYRGEGLPDNTISVTCTGSAGQSFGAFI